MYVCMLNWPFPRMQSAILRLLWRLGRCLVELHHVTVLVDEFRSSFLFALVIANKRRYCHQNSPRVQVHTAPTQSSASA